MDAEAHLGIAAELLRTFALADEPKILVAAVEEIHAALREAGIISELRRTLNVIIRKHKESPMEFSRQGAFIICDYGYSLERLDGKRVASFLEKAKKEIGGEHERELYAGS